MYQYETDMMDFQMYSTGQVEKGLVGRVNEVTQCIQIYEYTSLSESHSESSSAKCVNPCVIIRLGSDCSLRRTNIIIMIAENPYVCSNREHPGQAVYVCIDARCRDIAFTCHKRTCECKHPHRKHQIIAMESFLAEV